MVVVFFYTKAYPKLKFMFAFYAVFSTLGGAVTLSLLLALAKEILAFSICSCGWRDDQIRILQGTLSVLCFISALSNSEYYFSLSHFS